MSGTNGLVENDLQSVDNINGMVSEEERQLYYIEKCREHVNKV